VSRNPARRIWLAIATGIAFTAAAILLGNWQTRRGDEKELRLIQWERAGNANAISLQTDSELDAAAGQLPLRVALRGEFEPLATVFVDNRALDGIAGFQVVTPLRLASGTAVLINRGWLARDPADPARLPPLETPHGVVQVEGLAVARVPRLLELAATPLARPPAIWPNLELEDVERATGLRLARFVVQQTTVTGDGLRRAWTPPAAGVEKHWGYALQWYGMAALSAGLTLFFGGRAWLRKGGG
jgi:cytochrome oxidase assembly protein ShyY1